MFGSKRRQARREQRFMEAYVSEGLYGYSCCSPTRSSGLTWARRDQLIRQLRLLRNAELDRVAAEQARARQDWIDAQAEAERLRVANAAAETVAVSIPPKVWAETETVEPGDVYV